MKYLIFYLGACLMGLASLVSMLAIYSSNKRVLRDLKNPRETKDKWLSGFIQEYQKLLKDKIEIHNPSVYVTKRMRGRKIALWNIRQIKGISWGTFLLSFSLWEWSLYFCVRERISWSLFCFREVKCPL